MKTFGRASWSAVIMLSAALWVWVGSTGAQDDGRALPARERIVFIVR